MKSVEELRDCLVMLVPDEVEHDHPKLVALELALDELERLRTEKAKLEGALPWLSGAVKHVLDCLDEGEEIDTDRLRGALATPPEGEKLPSLTVPVLPVDQEAERRVEELMARQPKHPRRAVMAGPGADGGEPSLWECPDCAFGFDARHTNSDGSHTCPVCAEAKLQRRLEGLEKAATRVLGLANYLRKRGCYQDNVEGALVGLQDALSQQRGKP